MFNCAKINEITLLFIYVTVITLVNRTSLCLFVINSVCFYRLPSVCPTQSTSNFRYFIAATFQPTASNLPHNVELIAKEFLHHSSKVKIIDLRSTLKILWLKSLLKNSLQYLLPSVLSTKISYGFISMLISLVSSLSYPVSFFLIKYK